MRLGGEPESSNFEDRTGQSGGLGGGGFGGGGLGCLLPLVASRFGIGGVIVLVIGYFLLSSLGGLGGGGGGGGLLPSSGTQQSAPAGQSTLSPQTREFLLRVLGSTEQTWGDIFQKSGSRYQPTKLVAYTGGTQTACGAGQAAMGPFYCPNDNSIYLDTEFFNELSQRFQAPGDFAQAYVIAHEVGHHVQDLQGILNQAHTAQARASETEGNTIQVKVELQADCYAGVWGHATQQEQILEAGDIEEGLSAAAAVGDDRIQRQTTGQVNADTFTHGSSAQRVSWFKKGFASGDPRDCDTFAGM